jgi:hypothetical protein
VKRIVLLATLLAAALGGGLWLLHRGAREPEAQLTKAQRAALDDRMFRHGDDMTDLLFAIVGLDHGTAARLADALAAEELPAMPRDPRNKTGREIALGPRFRELHDVMRARARDVAAAAQAHDDARLSASFGRLAGSCAACHRSYARGTM